ncbi:MAG TPA: hypothetical protein VFA07_13075 [Chthonomonadaceae bacterium]|nr:hypothetical protein [Chthonomonadaceae bacterium]
MARRLAYFLFCLGIGLIVLGLALAIGIVMLPGSSEAWIVIAIAAPPACVGLCLCQVARERAWEARATWLRRSEGQISPLAESLIPQLYGEFSLYIIEAAERLGEERDETAVPALLCVLERCVEVRRPGWEDIAGALIGALATIGDRRALPVLYRLDSFQEVGLTPAIRQALAAIEPQASLLRPLTGPSPDTLLRPAPNDSATEEPQLLLRPLDSQSR